MPMEPLAPARLYHHVDPDSLTFDTTADLEELDNALGQPRATAAMSFGIGMARKGYNLFVLGQSGTGRHSLVRRTLEEKAAGEAAPDDWVYVHNFAVAHQPCAMRLPPGRGPELSHKMAAAIEDLRVAIPAVFESEEYRTRRQVVDASFKQQQENAFDSLRKRAEEQHIALIQTPVGMALAPMRDGEVLKPEQFNTLPEEDRQRIQNTIRDLQNELQEIVSQMPQWEKEHRETVRELNREMSGYAIRHAISEVSLAFADLADVTAYLQTVADDLIENVDAFLPQPEAAMALRAMLPQSQKGAGSADGILRRYMVNVIVDNSQASGAPVVHDDNPALAYLTGRIEHIAQMGALVTDFGLIKPGSLHKANGGYLILDARRLLTQPFSWDALKRTLRSGELRIQPPEQMYGMATTISLEPQPIPLDVKVVLIGEREHYYLLSQYDPDFSDLFKVAVDFEEAIDRDPGAVADYARLVAGVVRRENLRPCTKGAVARTIEHGSRLADDAEKLTLKISDIGNVLREADYWAGTDGKAVIDADDIQRAIDAGVHRVDRIRERSHEAIEREIVLIATDGTAVGQINGLSVIGLDGFRFGRPSRITARVRLGAGRVIDIEREVELGGPLHSKGVMILSAFLGAAFARDMPLSLSASLVFEQSYGGVDGDSASSAELYALLSALADAPIKQSLAVTGSVNQYGEVQAIGGVNEKIEGFFDICKSRGLTGEQGVLIPQANTKHLMLRSDVVDAAAEGRFRIYPVERIEQGIELLTGVPAGRRDEAGAFPDDSLYRRVENRLAELAEARRKFGAREDGGKPA